MSEANTTFYTVHFLIAILLIDLSSNSNTAELLKLSYAWNRPQTKGGNDLTIPVSHLMTSHETPKYNICNHFHCWLVTIKSKVATKTVLFFRLSQELASHQGQLRSLNLQPSDHYPYLWNSHVQMCRHQDKSIRQKVLLSSSKNCQQMWCQ